ncbi:hypothetical protein M436DRAFT_61611 [Aureobasidium namibiae CBS 147.97]|uniref:Uncharacterized protein n=1 Tax=Aureobasidium namibiae CBS 147.97 TaxID=1043004 RepID=A0A074WZI6_9PEZI
MLSRYSFATLILAFSQATRASPVATDSLVKRDNTFYAEFGENHGFVGGGAQHSGSFTIYDSNRNIVYTTPNPGGYAPCQAGGWLFKATADCFNGNTFYFDCDSTFAGTPKNCAMKQNDQTGSYLTSANAGDSTYDTFFANGVSGICALSWTADMTCGENEDVTVEKVSSNPGGT